MAGHGHMTRRMAHARTELHKKSSFNDVDPMTVIFASCDRTFVTFSVDIVDTFTDLVRFDTLSGDIFDTFSGLTFDTFSVDLTHLAELLHLA